MTRFVLTLAALTLLVPTLQALTVFRAGSPDDPTVLLKLHVERRSEGREVVLEPIMATRSGATATLHVGDPEESLVHLQITPVIRTRNLISVRVRDGDEGAERLVVVRPHLEPEPLLLP